MCGLIETDIDIDIDIHRETDINIDLDLDKVEARKLEYNSPATPKPRKEGTPP